MTINFHVPDGMVIPTTLALLVNGRTPVIYRQIPNQLAYEFTVHEGSPGDCDIIIHNIAECMSEQSSKDGFHWAVQKIDYIWGTAGLFHVYRIYFALEDDVYTMN